MLSHLAMLQAAFQEEKLSCHSKLGAGGEAQAAVSPADPSLSDPGCVAWASGLHGSR